MASIGSVLNIVGTISSLLSGAPVTLGGFSFQSHEVPETVQFGGKQKQTIHTRPGGQRQIDTLGEEPSSIAWSGIFLGAGSDSRAQSLDALRKAGQALTLKWGTFCYRVVIESIDFEYHRSAWITYKIACNVIPTQAQSQSPGLLGSLFGGLSNVVGQIGGMATTLSGIIPGLAGAAGIINTIGGGFGALGSFTGTLNNLVSGGGLGGVLNNVVPGGLVASVGSFANNVINGGVPALLSNVTGGISNVLASGFNGILQSTGLNGVLNQMSGVLTGGSIQTAAALQGIAQPLQAVTALAGGSAGATTLLAPVGVAQQVSGAVASIANNSIAGLNNVATNFSSMAVPQMAATLTGLSQAVATAPVMQTISSTLGTMARNLSNPSNG